MQLHIEDFEAGVRAYLSKLAHEDVFDLGGAAIFPRIDNQAKWKFARKDNHLHLNDGNNVYCFHLPDGESTENDFRAVRVADCAITDFHKDVSSHGTAQIHRADPGSIYFTLQDGRENPTYTFRHAGGKDWRAIPKARNGKTAELADPDEFVRGMVEFVKKANGFHDIIDSGVKGVGNLAYKAQHAMMSPSLIGEYRNPNLPFDIPAPLVAAGIGAGVGGVYDQAKRHLWNTDEENQQEDGVSRAITRYALPAALLGGANTMQNSIWPQYSQLYPTFTH